MVRSAEFKSRVAGRRDEAECTGAVRAVSGPATSADDHYESQHPDVCRRPGKYSAVHTQRITAVSNSFF